MELSTLVYLPLTEETRSRLIALGVAFDADLSEQGGRALLVLRGALDEIDADLGLLPACFRNYGTRGALCTGCNVDSACSAQSVRRETPPPPPPAKRPPPPPAKRAPPPPPKKVTNGVDR